MCQITGAETPTENHHMTAPHDSDQALADETADLGGGASHLDAANRAIIEQLQRDGRRSYGAIAEEVGLSEAAVRRRVQRLREEGIIQIVAVTDPLQLGFRRQAMVGIRSEGDSRQVAEKIAALDEVDYVVMVRRLLRRARRGRLRGRRSALGPAERVDPQHSRVSSTETFLYLKLAKQTYTWGHDDRHRTQLHDRSTATTP